MCCPYFIPRRRHDADIVAVATALAAGRRFPWRLFGPRKWGEQPDDEALQKCNLGYARCDGFRRTHSRCRPFLCRATRRRDLDSLVTELNHAPAESGVLEFSRATSTWLNAHRDERLQRQAECFLSAYLSHHGAACAVVRAGCGGKACGQRSAVKLLNESYLSMERIVCWAPKARRKTERKNKPSPVRHTPESETGCVRHPRWCSMYYRTTPTRSARSSVDT